MSGSAGGGTILGAGALHQITKDNYLKVGGFNFRKQLIGKPLLSHKLKKNENLYRVAERYCDLNAESIEKIFFISWINCSNCIYIKYFF